ncbi:MAG: hypothetical protein HYZ15_09110 [Sphingobacteriales bacterium]|nr:hypothetical protein [Sphingobacteriales bacterium]
MMLLFICLALVWFFVQYFERQRQSRREEEHERKTEAYSRLLEMLKNIEEKNAEKNK